MLYVRYATLNPFHRIEQPQYLSLFTAERFQITKGASVGATFRRNPT